MKPQVTLAMPVYNVEKYVKRALLSALNQSFESMEIIVVNDGTPDGSMDIVRRTMAQHPRGNRVRIIEHAKNIGTGATKNTAIDNADGEYIYFMDSDDEITSDCISTMMAAMQETEVDFVAASRHAVVRDEDMQNIYTAQTLPDITLVACRDKRQATI